MKRVSASRMLPLIALGTVGTLATLYAIYHLSISATRPQLADPHYTQMLTLTAIGLAVLLFVSLWQIISLLQHLRKHQTGARLSLSFALRMLFSSLAPIGVIGVFAWMFLSYDLGKTFNSKVAVSLEDALQLTRTSITLRANQALQQTQIIASMMRQMRYIDVVSDIEPIRSEFNAIELAEFDHQGNLVAFSNQDMSQMTVTPPSTAAMLRVNQENQYYEFSTDKDDDYTIKVLIKLNTPDMDTYYLQATYAMPPQFNSLANSVRDNYQQYLSFNYLQPHITTSLLLVFGLVIALTVLLSFWVSTIFGEHMTRPVRQLIRATQRVISGDFSAPVTAMPNNDLGILGNNFNVMLSTLKDAENMNQHIQAQLTEQNTFLGTILDNITAGVITFDWQGRLQTANRAAVMILDCDMTPHYGKLPFAENIDAQDSYEELMHDLRDNIAKSDWHQEITLTQFSERKILICRGSILPGQNQKNRGGNVIVFEDVTEFQQNQRNAAWEEVARRLAHEIKNPLTPIRLQSERLQRKLADKLTDAKDLNILERATTTITKQVDAMQQLVSDFSQFAKPIELRRQPTDVNALLSEIAELYPENELQLNLYEHLPEVMADAIQLRQVMINLTKNALEACPDSDNAQLIWTTSRQENCIVVSVEDNGPGFTDLSKDPFEPYVTSKVKGTGLGLAIVKKIITEHHGSIQAGHSKTLNGAKITFTLPIWEHHE